MIEDPDGRVWALTQPDPFSRLNRMRCVQKRPRVASKRHQLRKPSQPVPRQDAQIIKTRFSAFIQVSSPSEPNLKARGVDELIFAGAATNMCCESSARDAMWLNYKVVMVSDASATWTNAEHFAALAAF